MRPDTYIASLDKLKPVIQAWANPKVLRGMQTTVECPACLCGKFTITKSVETNLLSGYCSTAFCVNFTEVS